MTKPPTGRWPRVQFVFECRTCNQKITLSIYYGEKLAQWSDHEGHDTTLRYEFYEARYR